MSHSTVARRVDALEQRLAARLFDRSRGGYALTEVGRRMLPSAERVEHEMAALERDLVGTDTRLAGSVSLTCCDTYISSFLMPGMARFCREYPDIELHLCADSRPFDLSKREADIAIRVLEHGASPPEHLIGRRLAPVTICNYISQEAREATRWVAFQPRKVQEQLVAASSYPDLPLWGAFDSVELMAQAVGENLGISMLPTYVGDCAPGIRRADLADLKHVADLWLLSHPDLRDNARLRAAREHIAELFAEQPELFDGQGGAEHPTRSITLELELPP